MLTLFIDFRSPLFGRSNGHIPFRTFFSSYFRARGCFLHSVSTPRFFPVAGLSRLPPEEPGICDVNSSDKTLYRCRKVGRRDGTIGNRPVAVTGDERRGFDRSVSDRTETGNISVTYGLNDGKIRTPAGRGYSSDDVGFPRDIDSVPEPPGVAAEIGSMTLGRSGETEPLGSLVAGQHDYGAGNRWHVETEEGNAGEDGKEGIESRRRTPSNFANWSMNHNTSGSNLPSVVSRPPDDQCEGTQLRLRCSLRIVSDS